MGLSNPIVKSHMEALFGAQRAEELSNEIKHLGSKKRELMIVERIAEALREMDGKYVLPFCFRNENGTRTSHYLIFVSKNITAYTIMKEIMGKESASHSQGVPSFAYCAADKTMPMLFELTRPLDDLKGMLLESFAGKTLSMVDVFNAHHVGTPFLKPNYRQALIWLEQKGKIAANPPAKERRKNTFGDKIQITFP